MHIKIVDNKLHIDMDSVRVLKEAREVCLKMTELEGIGLIGLSAGQAWLNLDEICQTLDVGLASHLIKS